MKKKEILGIVGGMGPLASAEFVKTIYEHSIHEREQAAPALLIHSDPTFPDRTQALLAGEHELLLRKLIEILNGLREFGVSRIVICCTTIHHLLPRLPAELRARIISLLDVTLAAVAERQQRHLLISTSGTRKLRVYEQHPQWKALQDRIVLPDEKDQALIHHDLIYQIKKNRDLGELVPMLEFLLSKYGLDSFIAGCTEIHLLTKQINSSVDRARFSYIDPLITIAREMALGRL
jgi:aspartate racemase